MWSTVLITTNFAHSFHWIDVLKVQKSVLIVKWLAVVHGAKERIMMQQTPTLFFKEQQPYVKCTRRELEQTITIGTNYTESWNWEDKARKNFHQVLI